MTKFLLKTIVLSSILGLGFSLFGNVNAEALNNDLNLGLPFPVGKTYSFTGGAHPNDVKCAKTGFNRNNSDCDKRHLNWGSLDFTPEKNNEVGIVTAMADGRIVNSNDCSLTIDHGNGYSTLYYHLTKKIKTSGIVKKGDIIAEYSYIKCGNGNGKHVHITLYKNGKEENIINYKIGNYQPLIRGNYSQLKDNNKVVEYEGCMKHLKTGKLVCPGLLGFPSDSITNDGDTVPTPVPTPTPIRDVNKWETVRLIKRRGSNQCLEISWPRNGAALQTATCNANEGRQQFTFTGVPNQPWMIQIRQKDGFCVNSHKPKRREGVNVYKCNINDADQKFYFDQESRLRRVSYYGQDFCLNAYKPTTGKAINMWDCYGWDNDQKWDLI